MSAVWNGTNYSRAHACGLQSGGAASVANKKETDPVEVYFKASGDGITWPADVDAILVGTYDGTAKQFHVRQLSEAGRADIVVTNGVDYQRISHGIPHDASDWSDF